MQANNKYYSNKDKWEVKDFWVYVMSEANGGTAQLIGQQKVNLAKYVGLYYQQLNS